MLDLVKEELMESGVAPSQFISINFEDMSYSHLLTAQALHGEVMDRAKDMEGKVYLFFDEIQEVKDWEKCINSLRVALDCDIYVTGSNANLLSGELATYLGGRYVEFVIYPFSFAEFLELYSTVETGVSEGPVSYTHLDVYKRQILDYYNMLDPQKTLYQLIKPSHTYDVILGKEKQQVFKVSQRIGANEVDRF